MRLLCLAAVLSQSYAVTAEAQLDANGEMRDRCLDPLAHCGDGDPQPPVSRRALPRWSEVRNAFELGAEMGVALHWSGADFAYRGAQGTGGVEFALVHRFRNAGPADSFHRSIGRAVASALIGDSLGVAMRIRWLSPGTVGFGIAPLLRANVGSVRVAPLLSILPELGVMLDSRGDPTLYGAIRTGIDVRIHSRAAVGLYVSSGARRGFDEEPMETWVSISCDVRWVASLD